MIRLPSNPSFIACFEKPCSIRATVDKRKLSDLRSTVIGAWFLLENTYNRTLSYSLRHSMGHGWSCQLHGGNGAEVFFTWSLR